MSKHQKRHLSEPEELASWRDWVNHQYDPGYWPSRIRMPRRFYGFMLALSGILFILVALIGLLKSTGTSSGEILGGLVVGGGLFVAWFLYLLRKTQHKRIVTQRHRGSKRH